MDPNPPLPPPPPPCISSSTAQVLGKRKYDRQPIMLVQNQDRHGGGSAPQVLSSRLSTSRFSELLSIDTMSSKYPGIQPALSEPASGPKATTPTLRATFIHTTPHSIEVGRRPTIDRNHAQSLGALVLDAHIPSVERPRLPANPPRPKRQNFRPSRPLQNSDQVYSDLWIHILSFCEPKFLLEAKTLSSDFYKLLTKNSIIWKKSRINHYGADMPDCPKGLTEQQYVDLLAGRGCQSRGCHVEGTFKVHWMFQVRLCPACFKRRTMNDNELARHREHRLPCLSENDPPPRDGRALWELLPLARTDGRREANSRHVNAETNDWGQDRGRFAFLKTSFARLEDEYQKFRASYPPNDSALMAWARKIHRETMEHMVEANKLESWSKEYTKTVQPPKNQARRQQKIEFFEARAAKMSPPMDRAILWKMAPFKRNLKGQSPTTDRVWETLWSKIEPYRWQAEQVEQFEQLMASDLIEDVPQVMLFRRLHEHRRGREAVPRSYQPEQKFVLQFAQRELARCLNDGVADEDILLLCLKNVFDAYSMLGTPPIGLNFDGTTGPYRLTLDDARMIVEDVLEKMIPPHSVRGRVVFQSLRCRGCQRSDHIRTWSFVDAFQHILQTHARLVGEGLEYYQFAIPYPSRDLRALLAEDGRAVFKFPWYTVLWPRNLPLVPRHQDVSQLDAWQPDVKTEFIALSRPLRVSAFYGRRPLQGETADDEFALNFIHAAKTLNGVQLDGRCQMKIALKYALDLYAKKHPTEPPLSAFLESLDQLTTVNPAIELKFGCGICAGEDNGPRAVQKSKQKKTMYALKNHWAASHRDAPVGWGQGMMDLPGEDEVLQQIVQVDKKLQSQKDALAERARKLSTNIRKRPKSKSSVVLQMRLAAEVLDELFPREIVQSYA
ncbi:uncharacterized protein A1O5_11408 [Cladophialophora psammophila CBS 110553]|uniref:DUF7892 domain-containing protein n=1 Tax=Cladophialophora psammophila CBS 110553 TaxID=1182543 RepID=W9W6C6_9EURO|nr:uncharacterized protein A1O5_11408 [Cladophialophora psammophila CBS 110553]EXJ63647.1 hypothetical protein A1O5_11408 [Cladophialophora psammophila CBS 110553]